MDINTTINDLKNLIKNFDTERDWDQFHHPKELAISISLEAAELLENFQWEEKKEKDNIKSDEKLMNSLKDEIADVIIYSLNFANQLGIDVSDAIKSKIQKNEIKYPAHLVKGKSDKYTEYQK